MTCRVIPLDSKREEREYEQLLSDLQEFIEAKVMAGEPIVVIIEKNVSFWERLKEGLNEAINLLCRTLFGRYRTR